MQKVKVHRYVSGKRPEYAHCRSSDDESENEDFMDRRAQRNFANRGDDNYDITRRRDIETLAHEDSYRSGDEAVNDPRLRRLARHRGSDSDRESHDDEEKNDFDRERRLRRIRERRIQEPEILDSDKDDIPSECELQSENEDTPQFDTLDNERKRRIDLDDSGSDAELSDTEIEKRRQKLKNKMLQQRKEEEILAKEEEKLSESSDSESSDSYEEEESESEEENEPRLKPLFVSKKDRATITEKEKEAQKQKQMEYEAKRSLKGILIV